MDLFLASLVVKTPTKKERTKELPNGGLILQPFTSQPSRTPNGEPCGVEEPATGVYLQCPFQNQLFPASVPRPRRRMEDKTVAQLCAMAEEGDAYADSMFLSFETERLVHCA